jgi:1-acyl-sn-glycerol-3-phosphate acyltransferase
MATKGVLGNDPFQRGAAQRPSDEQEPKKAAPAKKAAKKAPASKPARSAPSKSAATKPAEGARAKKAAPPRAKGAKATAPRKKTAEPQVEASMPAEAILAAGAVLGTPVEPPPEPARTGERTLAEEPVRPEPQRAGPGVSEEAEKERVERAVAVEAAVAAEALQELEETLGEPLPIGRTVVVEVLDESQDEYAPGSEAEAAEEARIERVVEAALAPALPVSSHTEAFFTSRSPGAEPRRLGDRVAGLLSLAKEVAFQAVASERFGKTVGSARGLLSAALTSVGVGGGTAIDEYGKDAGLGGVMQPVLDFFYERYWRVSVQGASHVPAGPVLLVANHSGALPFDGPVLQQALSRERPDLQEARWLAEDQIFYAPMLGTLMNRLGAVRACPENALRLLDELRPVIVFPEGIQGLSKPFAQRYQLKRFGRGGFVKLALRTGAPIVPVAIVGAEETAPLFGKLPAGFLGLPYLPLTPPPLPARWIIRFGDPISMGDLPPEAAEDMPQVQRLTERTRESIQGMLQALLKDRRSVFAG